MTSTTSQVDPALLGLMRFVQQSDPCDAIRVAASSPATEQVYVPQASQDVIELEHAIESHWPQGRVSLVPPPQPLGLPTTCFSEAGSIRSVKRHGPSPVRAAQLVKRKLVKSLVRPRRASSPSMGKAAVSQQQQPPATVETDDTSPAAEVEGNKKKNRLSRGLRCMALLFLCKKKRDEQATAAQGPPVLAPFELSDESLVESFEANAPHALDEYHSMPAMPPSPGSPATYDTQGSFYGAHKLPTTSPVIFRTPECPRPVDNQDRLPEDSPLGLLCRSLSTEQAAVAHNQPQVQAQPSHGNGTVDDDAVALNKSAAERDLPWLYGCSFGGDLVRRHAIKRQGRARPAQAQARIQPAARRQLPQAQHTDSIPIPTLAEVVEEVIDVVERPLAEIGFTFEEDLPSSSSPSSDSDSSSSPSVGFSSSDSTGDTSSSASVYSNEAEAGDNDADVEPFVIEDDGQQEHEPEHEPENEQQEAEQPMEQPAEAMQHNGELPPAPLYLWDWRIESHSAFPSPFNFGNIAAANAHTHVNVNTNVGEELEVGGGEDTGFDSGFEADEDSSSDTTVTLASLGRLAPERNFGSWFTEVFSRRFWS